MNELYFFSYSKNSHNNIWLWNHTARTLTSKVVYVSILTAAFAINNIKEFVL